MVYPNRNPHRLQARIGWRKLRLELQTVKSKQIKLCNKAPPGVAALAAELMQLQQTVRALLREARATRKALKALRR